MYASDGSVGLTSRSRSSTDVFRESRLDKSETKFQSSYSTLGRSSRRPRAPTPPPRASPIKCYLSEDIRRQYENGYEAAEPVEPQNSFVRRLVATLERRQHDGKVNLPARLAHRPTLPGKPEGAPLLSRRQLPRQPCPELPPRGFPASRPFCPLDRPFSQPIREDEDDETTSEDSDFWSEATDSLPALHSQEEEAVGGASPSLKRIAQRALRKIGALIGRRAGRGLPKGSRDYYATRESLSDELGSFRRNTMPQLIKEARPGSADSTDQRRLDQIERDRQLAELLGSSQPIPELEGPRRPSTATIHPIYGKTSHAGQAFDEPTATGGQPIYGRPGSGRGSGDNYSEACAVYAALPIPIKGSARLNSGSLDKNEHLLRPSRVRDVEKSLARQEDAVQLRQTAEVIYDVPKSNRPVSLSSLSSMSSAATIPIYENADLFAVTDQRLNLPGFTTF